MRRIGSELHHAGDLAEVALFRHAHCQWVGEAPTGEMAARDDRWSRAMTGGGLAFANQVKVELGIKAMFREVADTAGTYTLWEPTGDYVRSPALRLPSLS